MCREVPKSKEDRSLVCDFPQEWWGCDPQELPKVSGIGDSQVLSPTGFLAAADTKEDAEQMARIALERR